MRSFSVLLLVMMIAAPAAAESVRRPGMIVWQAPDGPPAGPDEQPVAGGERGEHRARLRAQPDDGEPAGQRQQTGGVVRHVAILAHPSRSRGVVWHSCAHG